MATRHGLQAAIYMGSSVAIPVAETHGISVSVDTDFAEDSAQGDSWKTYIAGLNDFTVEISKWFDSAEKALINAVINKTVMKFYFYPDRTDNTNYVYGTGYVGGGGFDAPIDGIVDQTYRLVAYSQPTVVAP